MQLEVDRTDPRVTRRVDAPEPDAAPGTVVLRVDRFAITSNNVTYTQVGDAFDYWGFYPTEPGWGRVPAMAFSDVVASGVDGIEVGTRVFGFVPMTSHHVLEAEIRPTGFRDVGAHRANHAPAYRTYDATDRDPTYVAEMEDRILLLRGLFLTSFLVEDLFSTNDTHGADRVLITSASSKTSIALAHELRANQRARAIGLTSTRNVAFVEGTELYDEVVAYDAIDDLDASGPAVLVDMAGNPAVLGAVHRRFDDLLRASIRVGVTHLDAEGARDEELPGPAPSVFFAPGRMVERNKDWGPEEFAARTTAALQRFVTDSERWLEVDRVAGAEAVEERWKATVAGEIPPHLGTVASMHAED